MTLCGAYAISICWLGAMIICVPIVLYMAPLGFTSLLWPPVPRAAARVALGPPEIWLHAIFWSLFAVGLFRGKTLPAFVLASMYAIVVVLLLLTMAGCAQYYTFARDFK